MLDFVFASEEVDAKPSIKLANTSVSQSEKETVMRKKITNFIMRFFRRRSQTVLIGYSEGASSVSQRFEGTFVDEGLLTKGGRLNLDDLVASPR